MRTIIKNNDLYKNRLLTYSMLFFSAILYVLGVQSFISVAGTFSSGLGAFAQLLTYIVPSLNDYFSLIYIAMNIPLVIFFWKKVKKSFIFRTLFFLVIQAIVGSLFLIPEVKDVMTNLIFIEGKDLANEAREEIWLILVLAMIGAVLIGFATAIAWRYGGSTAGVDFIGFYYSTKKQTSVGTTLFWVSIVIIGFSFITTIALNPVNLMARKNWLMISVSSVLYVLVLAVMMNLFYPKYSKIRLDITSDKSDEIIKMFKKENFNHSYIITKSKSGYTDKNKTTIVSVVLMMEVKGILKKIYKIDNKVWISEVRVRRVFGAFSTKGVDK